MAGILPDPSSGAVVVRNAAGNCLNPGNVLNSYCPPAEFVTSCEVTALPSDCNARITPAQINAIVSELLCLAEAMDPNGPWNCNAVCNLASAFESWAESGGAVDGVTIIGSGTPEDPWKVSGEGVVAEICGDEPVRIDLRNCVNNLPAATTATIDSMYVLHLTSLFNQIDAAAQTQKVVVNIVWDGDPDVLRPSNVILRNVSATTGIEIKLSNNLRSHSRGIGPARLYLPPLGAIVCHSFQSGFWFLSTHLPSSALSMQVMARDALVRDYLADPGVPDEIDWQQAWQACHDDIRNTGGNMLFSEPHILGGPVFVTGYVGARGIAYSVTHRFGIPEPHIGAVVKGRAGLNLGTPSNYPSRFPNPPWDAAYDVPLGFFNVWLDPNITTPASGGRPRVNSIWENFGIIGEGMAVGHGIRNMGTMYQNIRNMSLAWLPSGAIRVSGRADISQPTGPGSANGCRAEDLLITNCGSLSGYGMMWASPDGHCENLQLGSCYGHQLYWSGSNATAEQIQSWNAAPNTSLGLKGENLYVNNSIYAKISGIFYDSSGSNVVVEGSTVHDVDLDVQCFRPNAAGLATGDPRNTSNIYIADGPDHLKLSGLLDGGNEGHYGLYQVGLLTNLTIDNVRSYHHVTDDYYMESRNIWGNWGGRRKLNMVAATPVNLFNVTSEDAVWEVMVTRLGISSDTVRATVVGGSVTQHLLNKVLTPASTVDLSIAGGVLQATCSATVTGLFSWYRVR